MERIWERLGKRNILLIGCAFLLVLLLPVLCVISCSKEDAQPQQETTSIQAEETTQATTIITEPTATQETTEVTTEPTEVTTVSTTEPIVADRQDPQKPVTGSTGPKVDIPSPEDLNKTEQITFGIDVSRYQGTIDWAKVAQSGTDFAMIRVGYRTLVSGEIVTDSNALYNLQQAKKNGIKLGVYFFSTAISTQEAIEEANWVADLIAQYPITYPVAYNCEGFQDSENRQYSLSRAQRTDIALSFLKTIKSRGYTPMFYGSQSDLQGQWDISRIEGNYKIWVAQYPAQPYPQTPRSAYSGKHAMWQYSCNGVIPGISKHVDVNIAYFGYENIQDAQNNQTPEDAQADVEALMSFTTVNEQVTAKIETNLRSHPSQGSDSQVLYTLKNGEIAVRIGISNSGWSKVEFGGKVYYAVSSFLTTDLTTPTEPAPTEPAQPQFQTQFSPVNEQVTAKDAVNLRTMPSTTHEDSTVVVQLQHGQVVTRTGINTDVGWSRVVYEGQELYCISSYLQPAEEATEPTEEATDPTQ